MAPVMGARALGLGDELGPREPGKKAERVLFDTWVAPAARPLFPHDRIRQPEGDAGEHEQEGN